jgi:hypothetical protein
MYKSRNIIIEVQKKLRKVRDQVQCRKRIILQIFIATVLDPDPYYQSGYYSVSMTAKSGSLQNRYLACQIMPPPW